MSLTNPFLFAIGFAFLVSAGYSFVNGDPRMGCMSLGLAFANGSLGW